MHLLVVVALLQAQAPPHAASVYRVAPERDIAITLGASVATLFAYLYADRLITPGCPCDPRDVNGFDRGAVGNTSATARALSDLTAGAAVAVPLLLDAIDLGSREPLMSDVIVFAQTIAINGLLVGATKIIVHRPLPRTYAGDSLLLGKPEGYRSFYSGHTSLVFAALSATAMTIRLRYGEKTWPWIVAGLVGTSVGLERIADGRHFPSDVIVGALMGTAVGILVPSLHARKPAPWITPALTPIPVEGMGVGMRVGVGANIRF